MNKQLQRYVDKELSRVEKDRKKLSKPLADIISQLSGMKKDIKKYDVLIQWGLVTDRACQYNQKLSLLSFQLKVFGDLSDTNRLFQNSHLEEVRWRIAELNLLDELLEKIEKIVAQK